LPINTDLSLWESLARNPRFQAWLESEKAKYMEAVILMADESQLRITQGRLQQLRDMTKLCEMASKT